MDELKKQRSQIRKLMEYAVPDQYIEAAKDLLLTFRDDTLALSLFHEFYSYLPEAQDDWIKEIRVVGRSQGVFLLAAVTPTDAYLYLLSSEGVEFHGSLSGGYLDRQLLEYFTLPEAEDYKKLAEDVTNFPLYNPIQVDEDLCPACHAATGEEHELGCPVEICPWCGGQLIHCSCRFDKLGLDALDNDEDLARFEKILEQQGRIVYSPEQRPSFADDGSGILQQ